MITQHPEVHAHAAAGSMDMRPRLPAFRAARLWPWVPGLLLAGLLGTQLLVLSSALEDPGFSTERDYYRRAVAWDAHMARLRESHALGWTARASSETMARGGTALSVELADARGNAIREARIRGIAFHNARASHELELELAEVSPGVYRAPLGRVRPGLWEVRLAALRGADLYEAALRFEVRTTGTEP